MEHRNEDGTFKPGHGGAKPKGAKSKLPVEIREKLWEFLQGESGNLKTMFDEVPKKDRLKVYSELLAYAIPKQKELRIEDVTPPGAHIDYTKLKPETLKEILNATSFNNEETES